jgi:predicted nucleic acid-binding protein
MILVAFSLVTDGTVSVSLPELSMRDPDDNEVLAAAIEGEAALIVTQDKDLLDLEEYQGVQIVEPPELHSILTMLVNETSDRDG